MKNNQQGWVKIHRQILGWEWYDEPNTFRLFLHLLIKANHKEKKYRGVLIKKGQVMTGQELLAQELKLTRGKIRLALNNLKTTNEITIKSSSKGTIIQIVNYKNYQIITSDIAKEQPTNNQQTTTNKNVNNEKNVDIRLTEFKNSLQPYLELYGSKLLNEFYLYWTEKKPKGKKMLFEMQKTFDVSRRLKRWSDNDFNKKTETVKIGSNKNREKEIEFVRKLKGGVE